MPTLELQHLLNASVAALLLVAVIYAIRSTPAVIREWRALREVERDSIKENNRARDEYANRLVQANDALSDAVQTLREVTQDYKETRDRMIARLAEHQDTIEARDARIEALEEEIKKLRPLYQEAKDRAAAAEAKVKELVESLQERDRKVSELENALNTERRAREKAEERVDELNTQIETLRSDMETQVGNGKEKHGEKTETKPAVGPGPTPG